MAVKDVFGVLEKMIDQIITFTCYSSKKNIFKINGIQIKINNSIIFEQINAIRIPINETLKTQSSKKMKVLNAHKKLDKSIDRFQIMLELIAIAPTGPVAVEKIISFMQKKAFGRACMSVGTNLHIMTS
ncbi:hypothetical protein ACJX0J_027172, partial [Zea mays]